MEPERKKEAYVQLQDLALIGGRRTCALLDKQGTIVWYFTKRFDNGSWFAHLLHPAKGGQWSLEAEGLVFEKRAHLEYSALLQTHFCWESGRLLLEDSMPLNARFYGICRKLLVSPVQYTMALHPRPNYARQLPILDSKREKHATLEWDFHCYALHPITIESKSISCQLPAGEEAWFILAEKALDKPKDLLEVREIRRPAGEGTRKNKVVLDEVKNTNGVFRDGRYN